MGFLAPLLGAILPSILGGIGGASNTRPPSLDPTQQRTLDQLLPQLLGNVQGPIQIDPVQQALMYGQIAANQTGANNAITHALVSRGLGHSGLLGQGLIQAGNQAQASRNEANLGLQQQAFQQRQLNLQDILGMLNVGSVPGQSKTGGFFAGMAPLLAYSIQSGLNRNSLNGGGGLGPVFGGNSGG